MGIELRLPNIKGNDKEQLVQIRSYLYQLTEQLQWALNNINTSSSNYVAPQVQRIAASAQTFTNIQHMSTPEIGSTAADFVTDIGVSYIDPDDTSKGYWRYRKWKSGAVDLNGWCNVTPTKAGVLSGTSVYYTEQIQVKLPFSVETFQYTLTPATNYFIATNAAIVDDDTIGFRLLRFTDINVDSVYVRIMASGRYT